MAQLQQIVHTYEFLCGGGTRSLALRRQLNSLIQRRRRRRTQHHMTGGVDPVDIVQDLTGPTTTPATTPATYPQFDLDRQRPRITATQRSVRDRFLRRIEKANNIINSQSFEFNWISRYNVEGAPNTTFLKREPGSRADNHHHNVSYLQRGLYQAHHLYQLTQQEIVQYNPVPLELQESQRAQIVNRTEQYQYADLFVDPSTNTVNLQYFYIHAEDDQLAIRSFIVPNLTPDSALRRHGVFADRMDEQAQLQFLFRHPIEFGQHFTRHRTSGNQNFCGWYTILQILVLASTHATQQHNAPLQALMCALPQGTLETARTNMRQNMIQFSPIQLNAFVTHLLGLQAEFRYKPEYAPAYQYTAPLIYDMIPQSATRKDGMDLKRAPSTEIYPRTRDLYERGYYIRSAMQDMQAMTQTPPRQPRLPVVDGSDPHMFMEKNLLLVTAYFQIPVYLFSRATGIGASVSKLPSILTPLLAVQEVDDVNHLFETHPKSFIYLSQYGGGHYEFMTQTPNSTKRAREGSSLPASKKKPSDPGQDNMIDLTADTVDLTGDSIVDLTGGTRTHPASVAIYCAQLQLDLDRLRQVGPHRFTAKERVQWQSRITQLFNQIDKAHCSVSITAKS